MPKNKHAAEMKNFAKKLSDAYKKLQKIVDPNNKGLLNSKLDKVFIENPKNAIETFNAMLKQAEEYYNSNKGEVLDKNKNPAEIKQLSKTLQEIKSAVKEITLENFEVAAKKPLAQMLEFISKILEIFSKMLEKIQDIKNKPIAAPKTR